MRLSIKVLLAAVFVLILAMAMFDAAAYAANDSHYYSYTKAIKYCGASEGCVMQDFVVHCLGNRVVDIEPLAERIYVPMAFERDDPFGWCNL